MEAKVARTLDPDGNVYSQAGEDRLIDTIFRTLRDQNRWCVEFGAWDGKYLSNTRHLIEHRGFSAILIEGDRQRFEELKRTVAGHDGLLAINKFVGFDADDNLDTILSGTPVPKDFDFLSIDIDGNDYHVWKAMSDFRPKVVCVEFNPTIPTDVRFVQPADRTVMQGCSLLSLVDLGRTKGYELIGVTHFNAFFTESEYFHRFGIADNRPEALRRHLADITHIFIGYDGTVMLAGSKKLPWHDIELRESRMQRLPTCLRTFPANYSALQRALFVCWTNPSSIPRTIVNRLKRLFQATLADKH